MSEKACQLHRKPRARVPFAWPCCCACETQSYSRDRHRLVDGPPLHHHSAAVSSSRRVATARRYRWPDSRCAQRSARQMHAASSQRACRGGGDTWRGRTCAAKRFACSRRGACASLCAADCTPTAIVTLTAQTHDCFGMSELTRVGAAAARARASGGFGAGTRV